MSPWIISVAAFFGVAALVGGVAILMRSRGDDKLEDRLSVLTTRKKAGPEQSVLKRGMLEAFQNRESFLQKIVSKVERLGLLFDQAGTSLTADKFFMLSGGLGVAAAIAVVVAGLHVGLAPVAGIFGALLPLFWLMWRRKRRIKKFASQLPDALELLSRALRAGHSLAAGFQLVGTEVREPLGTEFGRVFEEQNLGIPLEEALDNLVDRIPNLDLKFFCTAVSLQRQTGGDLAEILDKIGHLVRERFMIWGQIQSLTGEGRLSGIVLLALPPVLFVTLYRLNPDYMNILFTDPMGHQMLFAAVVMQVLGALVIRKIVNIKV